VSGAEDDEARLGLVRDVLARLRHRVDLAEVALPAQVGAQPLLDQLLDGVGLAGELLGAVLGELGDRRLRRVPVAVAVLVEVRRGRRQPPQCVAEDRRRLAGRHAPELDAAVLDAAVRGRRGRRRAEVHGSRDPPAS